MEFIALEPRSVADDGRVSSCNLVLQTAECLPGGARAHQDYATFPGFVRDHRRDGATPGW
jgi:hypothetical protein